MPVPNILLLGGTTEASVLARHLARDGRFAATLSLAGVTQAPRLAPIPGRVGGFGGVPGLVRFLRDGQVAAVIDATHPFAAQMTRHAVAAAADAGVPLLIVRRPPWTPVPGDRWQEVPGMDDAARALGPTPRRVLLTVGRKDLLPFAAVPWHRYLVRSIDPPPPSLLPPGAEVIGAAGPFTVEAELDLLRGRGIEVLVSKNSGGTAVAAKLEAARILGLPVVMMARPPAPEAGAGVDTVPDVPAALAWLDRHHEAGTLRGE